MAETLSGTTTFNTEREGQLDFFTTFLPRIDNNLSIEDILADDNDGVINGNLLEFKLRISDLNAVVFQCVKYLSALRIKGKNVPANMLAIDLQAATAYLYKSADYLDEIERVYSGGASKNDTGFVVKPYVEKYETGRIKPMRRISSRFCVPKITHGFTLMRTA